MSLRIPRSVQAAVQQRSDRLSETARELLTLAAVAGRRFDVDLLLQITQRTETQFLTPPQRTHRYAVSSRRIR